MAETSDIQFLQEVCPKCNGPGFRTGRQRGSRAGRGYCRLTVCGVGSEIRQPHGYAIVGGLALSHILTLYTTPVIYICFDKLQTWIFRRRTQAPAAAPPQPAE
jgi:hypothetical protein|nr:efflux RND transporter permease subunit [Bradyrhizobium erythrophlei]